MTAVVHEHFHARRWLVLLGFALASTGLLWRAFDLQLNHKDFLQTQGNARHLRIVKLPAHRGMIVDRNDEPLAVSTPVDSVWVNPGEFAAARGRWPELTRALGLDPDAVAHLVEARGGRPFVYLKRHVDPRTAAAVTQLALPGVHLQREYRRYYPMGEIAGHVVGFTNVDDAGQEGMELAFDALLQGEDGSKRVLRDRLGRVVEDVESIRVPRAGRSIALSIDRRIQFHAYRALLGAVKRHRARGGSAVVLDVRTGEVLAMVNQPSYNPNNGADRVSRRVRNRAVTDVFEPGSAIKPFTVAAALAAGILRADSPIDTTPGLLRVGKHTVRDVRNYGLIDVATVIKKSSNVGASKIGLALRPKTLWRMFTRVGFGVRTGAEFPGEVDGVLTPFFEWREIHRVTLSYGYGISTTPLQLARAYAAIGNGGELPAVTFLRSEHPAPATRAMSPEVAAQLRRMLESVTEPGGTGRRARVNGYRVGGKTGTVRKSVLGGYAQHRYLAVFVGMAPMSAPRLVTVVVIDEPSGKDYYGGLVAAPVFAEIMAGALRVLGVAPDDRAIVRRRISLSAEAPRVVAHAGAATPLRAAQ